ncbi:hypothetical protein H6P81_018801 [Aristolochia fimbriata]|uniref:DNA 5'-3' helicase FANCJ n=1 Tax=Aristolochia fimbriata TaxID=158543 RepID=A0AAV7E670_ARIFI|nr:hypothetical protein H6P81_018801 [Aristolochia fimbriata]
MSFAGSMKSGLEQFSSPMASPAPEKASNVYTIGGIPVEFPHKPYGTQLAFMGRVIATLDKAQRQGRCHALLESPTGTGKSLSLLCSTLAWQKNFRSKPPVPNPNEQSVGPDASLDPLAFGGGFIPEPESLDNSALGRSGYSSQAANSKKEKKHTVPRIYYSTRTHGQISQVIREYSKTSYRGPMAVLASRKHYCTNRHVCGKENVDDECKKLLKDESMGCPEFKNVHRIKSHSSLQKGGSNEVHDIEDLVKIGQAVRGCSYFAARSMAEETPLVFCPYNYILNPTIRKAMEVDLRGAIVILDEAHNVEDIARDAGSLDVEEESLDALLAELGQLCLNESESMVYQPLYDMIQGIISWIGQKKDNLERREFEHYFSCWTGSEALAELQEAGATRECFPILQECAVKAIKAASEADMDGVHLSGRSAVILEGLFSTLSYFFSENGAHVCDYRLALQKYVKRDASLATQNLAVSLNLWLLNPAVVFKEIAGLSLSIILTSGTLSPMGSFASELGVQFETCMEAPHVIDVESQLWAAVIPSGPGNYRLNASYKTADRIDFQDALGASLEEICKVVPGGVLVFFPSYKLLEKLQSRWIQTGQWSRLNAQKPLFVEPRGNHEDFESVLKCYYDSIHGKTRRGRGAAVKSKPKKGNKPKMDQLPAKEHQQKAAAFLAVCRGKVSEGIDFADDNARVVVVVGIPFPNINDIHVVLKKKYNDTYKTTRNLLSGSQWYCYQAFRALNQAIGRCIRHRLDYGAIILLDERFKKEENTTYISKWLRKSIKYYDNFDMSMEGLRNFFKGKEDLSQNDHKVGATIKMKDYHMDREPLSLKSQYNKTSRKQARKKIKCDVNGNEAVKIISDSNIVAAKSRKVTQFLVAMRKETTSASDLTVKSDAQDQFVEAEEKNFRKCTQPDLNASAQGDTRCSETILAEYYESSSGESIVQESIGAITMDEATSAMVEDCNELLAPLCGPSFSDANLSGGLSERSFSVVTPELKPAYSVCGPELEPSSSRSVNSQSSKRRLPISLQMCVHSQTDPPTSSDTICGIRNTNWHIGLTPCHTSNGFWRLDMLKNTSNDFIFLDMDKKLHLSCLSCNNPLGLPEHNFFILCSLALSSKDSLVSFYRNGSVGAHLQRLLYAGEPSKVSVAIADISSVNNHMFTAQTGKVPLPGVWCEEDGCVFRVFSCCFCMNSGNNLGVQVLATDSSNTHLMNKVIFYVDRVLIKGQEDESEEKPLVAANGSNFSQPLFSNSLPKDPCTTQSKSLVISSSTKSKLRLPKRLSTTGRCITEHNWETSDMLQ